ncbi:hypothetical protein MBLNU230_g1319t1 [Neophaeotheca triangularis]
MRQVGSALWPKLRVLQVYGANTGVGKTILSSILCSAFRNRFPNGNVNYLKPISTGPLDEADDHHISLFENGVTAKCLYQFQDPVSPHIAARSSKDLLSDNKLATSVEDELFKHALSTKDAVTIVETAGGVLSPSPSGSSQADLYRPLRLPVFLVGDHRLGGIGTTISAWESLHMRGYDVQAVATFAEDRYDNHSYLRDYFAERGIQGLSIPPPPEPKDTKKDDAESMRGYYEKATGNADINTFVERFLGAHDERVRSIQSMPESADRYIWHPFMQHSERSHKTIVAMDSAYGDHFQTYSTQRNLTAADGDKSLLKPAFDGSASWWTQGLGHGNPQLALTAAHAAGRYGHVMFANAVHEPALTLAKTLVNQMDNPRLKKVFYTDNGSTGMEVAVKMATTAARRRYQQPSAPNPWKDDVEPLILGFKGSYHGDTIGTMDCSEPSVFNKKVEWYTGRGHWLDFPTVKMRKGQWIVEPPEELEGKVGETRTFNSLDEILDQDARSEDRIIYRKYLDSEIARLKKEGAHFGALILEPVILGAGGMFFADPLYQRCLVESVREATVVDETFGHGNTAAQRELDWQGMPVIFDEVFTGLYRLGRFSAASFLGVNPDIVVNAKLLTGGLLPLCTTTASDNIFEAFLSDDKSDALLHGHSYTAHAVGCAIANESLKQMRKLDNSEAWNGFKTDWSAATTTTTEPKDTTVAANLRQGLASPASTTTTTKPWSMWTQDFVTSTSHKPNVDYVFALGSVCAISLKDPQGSGYASTAATGLRDKLFLGEGVEEGDAVVHSRVLGNVLYLMASMTTGKDTIAGIEASMLKAL